MVSSDMTCCQKFAKAILVFINTIFFIVGAAVIGMAVYLQQAAVAWFDKDSQAIFSTTGLYVAMIFGGAIMLIALAGCFGALKGATGCGKCFLLLYSAVVLLVILVQLIVGGLILAMSGDLGDFGKNADVQKATSEFDKAVENFANQTYTTCCKSSKSSTDDVCKAIVQITTCNSEKEFKDDLYKWVSANFSKIGIGFIVIGAIELIGLFMACHLMCWAHRSQEKKPPLAQQPPQQQHGGDLAYGGTSSYAPPHQSYA